MQIRPAMKSNYTPLVRHVVGVYATTSAIWSLYKNNPYKTIRIMLPSEYAFMLKVR